MKGLALCVLALVPGTAIAAAAPVPVPPAANAPRVEVVLTPSGGTVGDRIAATLTLRVPAPGDLIGDPRFPVWRGVWGEAEVLQQEEPHKVVLEGGAVTWQQKLVLAAFRPGKIALPPAAVAVPLRARTVQATTPAGLAIDVRSVIPATDKSPQAKPPKPPLSLPLGAPFWWTFAALSAACLAAGLLLWRRARAPAEAEAPRPALPPLEELLAWLDRLASEPPARAHTGLSLSLRRFLGRALDFPAAESTTSEIHRRLIARRLPSSQVRQAVDLLRACDLVKFARQEPGEERTRERIDAARRVAKEIDEQMRPAEPLTLEATG